MKITLNYVTLRHLAEFLSGYSANYRINDKALFQALKEYFEDYDVEGIERNERPEKRKPAPFEFTEVNQ